MKEKEQFSLSTWLQDQSRKVVTRAGLDVRILCTDAGDVYPVVALINNLPFKFNSSGVSRDEVHERDLFFGSPSMDEFEKKVYSSIYPENKVDDREEYAKECAKTLRALVEEEIKEGSSFEEGVEAGKKEIVDSLPTWRPFEEICTLHDKDGNCVTTEPIIMKGLINDDDYRLIPENCLVNRALWSIPVSELKRLPHLAKNDDDNE